MEKNKSGMFKFFFASSLASTIGAIFVYPVDLVKTRMQAQSKVAISDGALKIMYRGSLDCFIRVLKHEGITGLFRGIFPNLIGQVPEKAIRLFVVDKMRKLFRTKNYGEMAAETIAGMIAGTCQVLITNPAEIIKVRMQVAGQEGIKTTSLVEFRRMGFRGAYKGASACFLRDIPFSMIYFSSYAYAKSIQQHTNKNIELTAIQLLSSGVFAGILAASIVTPADVVKTRMQIKPKNGEIPYSGLFNCFYRIYKTEGIKAFFKGMGPRVFRSAPQYGVMLLSYELLLRIVKSF